MSVVTPLAQLILSADADWNHMGGGAWVLMGLGMVLFWALVILGVVWLVRTLTEQPGPGAGHPVHQPSPLEILDRKLAEGAISVEDYGERRRILTGGGSEE